MTKREPVVPGIDATGPSVARVYDFWLGGEDNFAVDREMGGRMAAGAAARLCAAYLSLAGSWVAGIGGGPAWRPMYPLAAAVKTGD